METWFSRLRDPRHGVVILSSATTLLMAIHWTPMVLAGLVVIGAVILRPRIAVHPGLWWLMAGLWFAVLVVFDDRMEDHVYLFVAWLVALALSLSHRADADFVDGAAWHARILIGVTFTAAVAWKLHFGNFVTGTTLWVFVLFDHRFAPLATMVGLSDAAVTRDRIAATEVLAGDIAALTLAAPPTVVWRLVTVAVLALLLEAVVAVAHLANDRSRWATLRVPSLVMFAVVTYAVVPVVPFAALLGLLAMTAARWRREVLWVFPVMVIVAAARLLVLS